MKKLIAMLLTLSLLLCSAATLAMGEEWWLRSTAASSGRGRRVGAGGNPASFGDSNESVGVVCGFCL